MTFLAGLHPRCEEYWAGPDFILGARLTSGISRDIWDIVSGENKTDDQKTTSYKTKVTSTLKIQILLPVLNIDKNVR